MKLSRPDESTVHSLKHQWWAGRHDLAPILADALEETDTHEDQASLDALRTHPGPWLRTHVGHKLLVRPIVGDQESADEAVRLMENAGHLMPPRSMVEAHPHPFRPGMPAVIIRSPVIGASKKPTGEHRYVTLAPTERGAIPFEHGNSIHRTLEAARAHIGV